MHTLKTVTINLPHQKYKIYIGHNIYSQFSELLKPLSLGGQIAIISTPPVSKYYLETLKQVLGEQGQVYHYDVPDGERSKTLEVAQALYTWLIENNFERNSTIITLGGGVVGDLAGFVAATFLRGINLIHCPTSLLAQVDSSIGGKVGINHPLGKNLIGAFYQPIMILTDTSVIDTLPQEEFICGLGEVVKYGIIGGSGVFSILETKWDHVLRKETAIIEEIVVRCAQQKAKIVEQDEKESGLRSVLNLGHSFGHALETYYQYQFLKHGQAVLLGMKCAIAASKHLKLINSNAARRIIDLINKAGVSLPINMRIPDPDLLYSYMKKDKKISSGKINLILIQDIGKVYQKQIEDKSLIVESFKSLWI